MAELFAECLDHKVAMSVTGLVSQTWDVCNQANDPAAIPYLAHDIEAITDARNALNRLLSRLPSKQNEAA